MKDADHLAIWIYLLLCASHQAHDVLWNGKRTTLQPGQLITGRLKISKTLGVQESKVKRVLICFENDQQIDRQRSNAYSLISIRNWNKYQVDDQRNDQTMTSERPADDQRVTTYKNVIRRGKNVKDSPQKKSSEDNDEFLDSVISAFSLAYENAHDRPYEILNRGKERAAASNLLSLYRKKFPEQNSDDALAGLADYFAHVVNIQDKWFWERMSLSLIVSKYNEINSILTNGKHKGNNKAPATDAEIGAILFNHFGENAKR